VRSQTEFGNEMGNAALDRRAPYIANSDLACQASPEGYVGGLGRMEGLVGSETFGQRGWGTAGRPCHNRDWPCPQQGILKWRGETLCCNDQVGVSEMWEVGSPRGAVCGTGSRGDARLQGKDSSS
jgi:hypothetical protein